MKSTEGLAVKGKDQRPHRDGMRHKSEKPHRHAKHHKHEARDRDLNGASPAFEQIRRTLGGSPANDALLSPLRWSEQSFCVVAAPVSGAGKLRTKLLDSGREVARVPSSSWRTGLVDHPLLRPILRPHPDDSPSLSGSRRPSVAGQGLWAGPGDETWQISVRWTTGSSALVNTCRVSVRDWHTQRFLASVDLGPYRQDSAVACLERLSKRKGMPHALVMDHQPDMLALVEQWAFAHGVMVVICQWRRSRGDRSGQMY